MPFVWLFRGRILCLFCVLFCVFLGYRFVLDCACTTIAFNKIQLRVSALSVSSFIPPVVFCAVFIFSRKTGAPPRGVCKRSIHTPFHNQSGRSRMLICILTLTDILNAQDNAAVTTLDVFRRRLHTRRKRTNAVTLLV